VGIRGKEVPRLENKLAKRAIELQCAQLEGSFREELRREALKLDR